MTVGRVFIGQSRPLHYTGSAGRRARLRSRTARVTHSRFYEHHPLLKRSLEKWTGLANERLAGEMRVRLWVAAAQLALLALSFGVDVAQARWRKVKPSGTTTAASVSQPRGLIGTATGDRSRCQYGREPGYWWASKFKLFSKTCKLKRLVEQHSPRNVEKLPTPRGYRDKKHILLIGDSLDRNVVIALSEWSGRPFRDYTPMMWLPDGRPQKIGRSCIVNFHNYTYSNLFIFAANNEARYFSLWKEGKVEGMSDYTHERICQDGPRYLPYFPTQSPYLISVNSAYWEVARWERKYWRGHPDVLSLTSKQWSRKSVNQIYKEHNRTLPVSREDRPTYEHASAVRLGTPVYNGQVLRDPDKPEPDYMATLLVDFWRDMEKLMKKVEACYPDTKIYCWRTAPKVATDDRSHHFFQKRPHVVAALNQMARYAARKRGWCILDMEFMLQGQGNNEEFVPDGAHPAAWVNLEYANIILNVINEQEEHEGAEGQQEHEGGSEDPELAELLRKAVKQEEAYRETHPHPAAEDDDYS